MPTKQIFTENAPQAIGPYSQAIVSGDTVYLSGQIAIDPKTGNIEGKTIEEQTAQVLKNLSAVLEAAGSSASQVLRCTVYLTDISEFQAFNKAYEIMFGSVRPARSTVQVAKLPRDAKVEIDAIALKQI